jgi:hypothetical protein
MGTTLPSILSWRHWRLLAEGLGFAFTYAFTFAFAFAFANAGGVDPGTG